MLTVEVFWKGSHAVKKFFSLILVMSLLLSLTLAARADLVQSRAVIGADLTPEQVAMVYKLFGVSQNSVIQLSLTNAEERSYLEGYIDSAMIGTRSVSCVYIELLPAGSGIDIATRNITWCTPEIIAGTLATVGISDAKIVVAAPFESSGTAALAGIYKAYEDITAQKLDSTLKDVGTQELTVTGELAEQIGSADSTSIVSELKLILSETAKMDDAQIREKIVGIAGRYNVRLTETQINQLVSLCRSLEKLDPDSLKDRVEGVQSALGKVAGAKEQLSGFMTALSKAVNVLQELIDRIQALLDNFSH